MILASRDTVVQHHPFDIDVFLGQLRDEAIDYTVAAPAVLNQLLQQPEKLTHAPMHHAPMHAASMQGGSIGCGARCRAAP